MLPSACQGNTQGKVGRVPHSAVGGGKIEVVVRVSAPGANYAHRRHDHLFSTPPCKRCQKLLVAQHVITEACTGAILQSGAP